MVPTTWMILLVLVAVVGGLPLLFATMRPPVRGALLLGHLGLLQVIPGVLVAPYALPLTDGLSLTPANVIVAGVLLTAVLLIVVDRDPVLLRLSVLVVLVAGALEVALVAVSDWALSSGSVVPVTGVDSSLYEASLGILLAGTPVVVAEVLVAVVVAERLRRLVPTRWGTALAGPATLTLLLALDGVVFTVMTSLLEPGLARAVSGGVAGKLLLAALFGVPLLVFLGLRRPDDTKTRPLRLRDVVTVARRELVERVEQHERERIALLERTVTVAEEERRRVAEDLHDDAIQMFTAADLHLQRVLMGADGSDLQEVKRLIRSGVESLRRVLLGFSAPDPTAASFAPLVRAYEQRLQPEGSVDVELDVDLPTTVPDAVVAAAYRIVVEGLNNVVKHAEASTARITVRVEDGVLRGVVRDDGIGIPADASTGPGHLGLRAMRDRAESRGGRVEVQAVDGGTVVSFDLPLSARGAAVRSTRLA